MTLSGNDIWDSRARQLAGIMKPVVAWVRDKTGTRIEEPALPRIVSLSSLEGVIQGRSLSVRGADDEERPVDLTGMPDDVFASIRSYLNELPGWKEGAQSDVACQQHGYILWSIRPYLPALLT